MNTDIIQRAKLLVAMQQTQSDLLNVIVPALGYLDRESNEELIQLLELAADALQKMGYTNAISLDGGWRAWNAAGMPVEK